MLRANKASKSLGLNAAFLQEIKQDHRELHRLLDKSLTVFTAAALRSNETSDVLGMLYDQIQSHFQLEESFGYFEEAIADQPWLAQRAEQLRTEHDDLAFRMERMVQFAEDSSDIASVDKLRNEFHGFLAEFRRHESDENELILQAFNDELGVGD